MRTLVDIVDVYDLLYRLGLSANSTAFFHLSFSIYLGLLNPHWLADPSKKLYPEVAAQYHSNPFQICRDITLQSDYVWQYRPEHLCALTNWPLSSAPAPSHFLRILTSYMHSRDEAHQAELRAAKRKDKS